MAPILRGKTMYNSEVILWPKDYVGIKRTLIVSGNSLTIKASMVDNSNDPADYTIPAAAVTANGTYRLTMQVPLKFTPENGTTFRMV
jgi:hypothetical protein